MTINYVKNDDLTVTLTMSEEMFSEYFCFCKDCGELIFIREAVRIEGEYYCQNCTTSCDVCGRYLRHRDAYQTVDSTYDYCEHCYNNETYRCSDCGSRFRYEDDLREIDGRWYCDDCYDAHEPVIQSYHSMKDYGDIVFHGDESRKDALHMGFATIHRRVAICHTANRPCSNPYKIIEIKKKHILMDALPFYLAGE